MDAKPSLQSILLNIKDIMEKEGYASIDQLLKNQEFYIQSRKEKGVTYEDGIISQYTLGPTQKSGGYDRYTPFMNHPDADFLVTGLPMGMVQASCNPYKKERALKGVDLGQIKNEVLEKFRPELEKQKITFGTLKRISEMDTDKSSVGFTFKDFLAIYGNAPSLTINGSERLEKYLDYMSKKLFKSIPAEDRKVFNKASVNGYDVIMANSGGHKCITNISGINYIYSNAKFQEPEQRVRESYVDLLKDIQAEFVKTLKEKIKSSSNIQEKFKYKNFSNNKLIENQFFYIRKKQIKNEPMKKINLVKENVTSLPIKIGTTWQSPIKGDGDLLHSFETRRSDKKGALIGTQIEEKLKQLYDSGINPDITDLKLDVDSKNYTVAWSATIDESKDGKAYMGIATRGSAGATNDQRALQQIEPMKNKLKRMGAEDITLFLDFDNPKGIPIRQYFYKYTLPEKYPPHTDKVNYTRTEDPIDVMTSNDNLNNQNSNTKVKKEKNFKATNLKDLFSSLIKNVVNKFKPDEDQNNQSTDTNSSNNNKSQSDDNSENEVKISSGSDSDFMDITKKVIANFEGGYWNGSTTKNESTTKLGICKNHPKGSMGASTETMFGLDRYNGNIESSPEGREFFKIIDDEKQKLGMEAFCKKWKWLYRGGENEEKLKELAAKKMKSSFDRNMSNFVKDQEVKDKIMKNKGLLVHMTYACWNGPGFFKKFANELTDAVKQGKSDSELLDVAIQSRANTKLLNKDKVATAIKNPDGMKTA
jgi:hypothetical protein